MIIQSVKSLTMYADVVQVDVEPWHEVFYSISKVTI
jgi:hypothetical protein